MRSMFVVGNTTTSMDPIADHIHAIADRRHDARLLRAGAVPADHTQPVAREWIRRWGPTQPPPCCRSAAAPRGPAARATDLRLKGTSRTGPSSPYGWVAGCAR